MDICGIVVIGDIEGGSSAEGVVEVLDDRVSENVSSADSDGREVGIFESCSDTGSSPVPAWCAWWRVRVVRLVKVF